MNNSNINTRESAIEDENDFLTYEDIITDIENERRSGKRTDLLEIFKFSQEEYIEGLNHIPLRNREVFMEDFKKRYPQILLYLLETNKSIPFFSEVTEAKRKHIIKEIKDRIGKAITISKEIPIKKKEIVENTKQKTKDIIKRNPGYINDRMFKAIKEAKGFKYDGEYVSLGSREPEKDFLRKLEVNKDDCIRQKIQFEGGTFEKFFYYKTNIPNVYWLSYFSDALSNDVHENKLIYMEQAPKPFFQRQD